MKRLIVLVGFAQPLKRKWQSILRVDIIKMVNTKVKWPTSFPQHHWYNTQLLRQHKYSPSHSSTATHLKSFIIASLMLLYIHIFIFICLSLYVTVIKTVFLFICMCKCMLMGIYLSQDTCWGQKKACWSQFFPSIMWIPGIELRPWGFDSRCLYWASHLISSVEQS